MRDPSYANRDCRGVEGGCCGAERGSFPNPEKKICPRGRPGGGFRGQVGRLPEDGTDRLPKPNCASNFASRSSSQSWCAG